MIKLITGLLVIVFTATVCFSETFFWEDKKGIQTTNDVSKLPPKFRKKYEALVNRTPKQELVEIYKKQTEKVVEKTIPESAKNAIRALRKLDARCQVGISPRDYSPALGDAQFEVNMFIKSKDAKDWVALKQSIIRSMDLYIKAGEAMNAKLASAKLLYGSYNSEVAVMSNREYDQIVERYLRVASESLDSTDKLVEIILTTKGFPYPPGQVGAVKE